MAIFWSRGTQFCRCCSPLIKSYLWFSFIFFSLSFSRYFRSFVRFVHLLCVLLFDTLPTFCLVFCFCFLIRCCFTSCFIYAQSLHVNIVNMSGRKGTHNMQTKQMVCLLFCCCFCRIVAHTAHSGFVIHSLLRFDLVFKLFGIAVFTPTTTTIFNNSFRLIVFVVLCAPSISLFC